MFLEFYLSLDTKFFHILETFFYEKEDSKSRASSFSQLKAFASPFQVDAELNKELEQWNEMLKSDAVKLCQENNFNSGFFEGSDSNYVVDAYELKVLMSYSACPLRHYGNLSLL